MGCARPRAARRLLQSNHSASTTMDDPNSAHHVGGRPPTQLRSRMATANAPGPHPRGHDENDALRAANRAFTGQGSDLGGCTHLRRPDASLRDRSRRELRPAPLGSNTSCRDLVTRRTGAVPPRPCAVADARSELAMTRERVSAPSSSRIQRACRRFLLLGSFPTRPREETSLERVPRCLPSSVDPC